jgi:two-component system sensor histidine kinase VicK
MLDPDLTRIIFQNLLTNAVKYTPSGGKISLKIELRKKHVLIKISDTGYGVPKRQQRQLFTKLFRADNVRRQDTDGTGLGLYIVQSIVESAQGKVWFESEENKGTTFYVRLPLKGMPVMTETSAPPGAQ